MILYCVLRDVHIQGLGILACVSVSVGESHMYIRVLGSLVFLCFVCIFLSMGDVYWWVVCECIKS